MKKTLITIAVIIAFTCCVKEEKGQTSHNTAGDGTEATSKIRTGEQMLEMLNEQGLSLLVYNDSVLTPYNKSGIQDLLQIAENNPSQLLGATVADKIIGKAAAALMIICGVREVHTNIICTQAKELLEKEGIEVHAKEVVPRILNKDQSGQCPMDARLEGIEDAEECVQILRHVFSM